MADSSKSQAPRRVTQGRPSVVPDDRDDDVLSFQGAGPSRTASHGGSLLGDTPTLDYCAADLQTVRTESSVCLLRVGQDSRIPPAMLGAGAGGGSLDEVDSEVDTHCSEAVSRPLRRRVQTRGRTAVKTTP